MNEWREVKLGDVCKIRRGSSPRPIKDYISTVSGMPWVKISDATESGNRYIESTKQFIKFEGVDKSVIVQPGSLILSNSGTAGLPKFMGIKACIHDGWQVFEEHDGIDKFFLYYLLIYLRKRLLHGAYDSTMKNLTLDMVREANISLPLCPTQRRIAAILSSLDDKIENNRKTAEKLEEIAQAVFKRWFVDFEFPNSDGKPYKSSGGEMVYCDEFGKDIPEGSKVGLLGDIIETNTDTYSKKDNWNYINYLDTGNITNNKIDKIVKLEADTDKIPSRAKRKVKANDIIYSTVRPNQCHYGLLKDVYKNMLVSTGFVVIRSKIDYVCNEYIYLTLIQSKSIDYFQNIGETSTSTYPSIKPSHIETLKIVIPNKKTLTKINSVLSFVYTKIYENDKESKILKQTRDALLPKLMSGEIDLEKIDECNKIIY